MRKQLMAAYYDEANHMYELEFDDGKFLRIREFEYPEAKYDEDYFENQELIDIILMQSEL